MYEVELAAFAAVIAIFALVSQRVEKFNVTEAMMFVVAGMIL